MNNKRRTILKMGGQLAAGLAIAPLACKLMPKDEGEKKAVRKKLDDVGLQLYSLRNSIAKDPKGVLKQVAEAGYKHVESFDIAGLGIFAGMGNKGFADFIGSLGMKMHSVHTNVTDNYEKKVEELAAIGTERIIMAYEGPGKTLDEYRKFADEFNKKGEFANKHGMRFLFHNHDFSFKLVDGVFPQDILMERTDKDLVDFQMDHYWVVTAGQDPIAWLNKYPDRFKSTHFKDRLKGATEREGPAAMCELGKGSINFQEILDKSKKTSVKYYIVDQDNCNDQADPIACIRADVAFMRSLTL